MTNICPKRALAVSVAVTLLLSPASLVRAQAGVERKVLNRRSTELPLQRTVGLSAVVGAERRGAALTRRVHGAAWIDAHDSDWGEPQPRWLA